MKSPQSVILKTFPDVELSYRRLRDDVAVTESKIVKGLGTIETPLVVTTAKLTAGGTQGSMTFISGILTASTPAT